MKNILFIFLSFNCFLLFISCKFIFGIKKIKSIDEKSILYYSKKYNIPPADSYELDTTFYTFLKSLDQVIFKMEVKNHYQPLQALYFDKSGKLISYQINCYAGGIPNLNWNLNGTMETFPPKQQAPLDTIVPLYTQLKFLKPMSFTEKISSVDFDYFVVIFWSKFMGRQSKHFISCVQQNQKIASNIKVKILYVNTDNFFAKEYF